MPTSVRILLIILAIILFVIFVIAGVRMRTKKRMSMTEITVRSATLIIYSAVMFLANEFLDDADALIAILFTFGVLEFGYNVYYIHKIKTLREKIHSLENDD